MVPALVDFRTSTSTSQMQAKRSSLQNPNPKSKYTSPPIFFDSTGFSSSNLSSSEQQQQRSSIPNANEGNFGHCFVSPSMPRMGSEKPMVSPSPGLTKPRLVKVRKHFVSHQGRSTHLSESQVDSGFNPFCPVSESKGSTSSDAPGVFDFGKSKDSGFVFEANWRSSTPNSNSNSKTCGLSDNVGKSLPPDESGKLNIDQGMEFQSITKDASFSTGERVNLKLGEFSEKDAFVFGSSFSQSNSVLNSNSKTSGVGESAGKSLPVPDEMTKFTIGSRRVFQSAKDGLFSTGEKVKVSKNGVFVFGSSSKKSYGLDGNTSSKLQDEMKKLNIESSEDGGNAEKTKETKFSCDTDDTNTFIFESRNNIAGSFGRSTRSKFPDEIKKLDVEDSENNANVGKTKDSSLSSKANDKSTFVFGASKDTIASTGQSSASTMPNEMRNLNVESLGYGGVEKTKGSKCQVNMDPSIFGSNKNTAGSNGRSTIDAFPDKMKNLNIWSKIGENCGCPNMVFTASKIYVKDKQNGISMDKIFHNQSAGDAIHPPFTFQAGMQDKSLGVDPVRPFQRTDHSGPIEVSVSASSFSSAGPGFHTVGNGFETPYDDSTEKKAGFSFTSIHGLGKLHTDLRTTKQDASCSSTGNLFAEGLNPKLEFCAKRGVKNTQSKKGGRGKWRQSARIHRKSLPRKNSSQENSESSGCYSPMDFSPYHETLAADQCSRETSLASDEPFHLDASSASTEAHPSVFIDATYGEDISENNPKYRDLNKERSAYQFERGVGATQRPLKEFASGTETECLRSKNEKVDTKKCDTSVAATEGEAGLYSNIEKQASDGQTGFCFGSTSEDFSNINFTFAAPSSAQGHLSAPKRHYRKKNRKKVAQDSPSSTSNAKIQLASPTVQVFPITVSSLLLSPGQVKEGDSSTSQSKGRSTFEGDKELEVKQASISTAAATSAIQEACEKWRLRGNQAYAKGNLSKAEDYYTCGVNCVPPNETSKRCIKALVLCYSNRAATRMSLGRMREALVDCKVAGAIDPNFLKVQVRAANCYLALGEIEDALKYFKKCLESGGDLCLDQKIVIEASDGLKKAQKMAQYVNHSAELLQQRTSNDAKSALQIIAEALSISPYSDKLVEMKAEALLVLRKYEEVVQLCKQSLDSADKSSAPINTDVQLESLDCSESLKNTPAKLQCWYLISKAYFYLGRLEDALDSLEKLEQLGHATENCGSKTRESFISFAVTVRDLLRHKAAGNEAFQSGRHLEAVEHYTAALSCSVDSHPFAAICFCNRAAAHQALGQISDAIADCSLAIALERNYPKAVSRRATLHEMIRDYRKATSDLQILISLLKKQPEDKTNESHILASSASTVNDLRKARLRLSTVEKEAKKEIPLNMYLILGIEPSATAACIKKAYRKAALRHHPDKASQFLARGENVDDGLWKEVTEEVHKEADRLFKMIGEAYGELSDSAKRSQYDFEEEMRNAQKKCNESSMSRPSDDHDYYPFGRRGSRRQWPDMWKYYGDHGFR